jgi:ubiquinone/menaquinone biosynthesis C-methylase UbiE
MRPNEQLYFERLARPVRDLLKPGLRILDAGCGMGVGSEFLTHLGCRVTGIDVEEAAAEWEKRRALGITFQHASAETLPFPDAHFDAVWVKDALHHMADPARALDELQRVTRLGGPVVVVEANRYNPIFYVHLTLLGGHQHFTRAKLKRLLAAKDPGFRYAMAESRCLPWTGSAVLKTLEIFEDLVEAVRVFRPWQTYQVAVISGKGSRP